MTGWGSPAGAGLINQLAGPRAKNQRWRSTATEKFACIADAVLAYRLRRRPGSCHGAQRGAASRSMWRLRITRSASACSTQSKRQSQAGNVVLSPVSAALNLAMVLNGADGRPRQEMLAALSLGGSRYRCDQHGECAAHQSDPHAGQERHVVRGGFAMGRQSSRDTSSRST